MRIHNSRLFSMLKTTTFNLFSIEKYIRRIFNIYFIGSRIERQGQNLALIFNQQQTKTIV